MAVSVKVKACAFVAGLADEDGQVATLMAIFEDSRPR
jgi:hypothetical protein